MFCRSRSFAIRLLLLLVNAAVAARVASVTTAAAVAAAAAACVLQMLPHRFVFRTSIFNFSSDDFTTLVSEVWVILFDSAWCL